MATVKGSLNVCSGTETVSTICKVLSAYSVNEFIQNNSNNFKKYNPDDCAAYEEYYKSHKKEVDKYREDYKKDPSHSHTKPSKQSGYSELTKLFINGVKLPNGKGVKVITPQSSVKDYLRVCNNNNLKVVQGLIVAVPYKKNGGVIETSKYYLNNVGIPKLLTNSYVVEYNRAMSVKGFRGTKVTTCHSYFQRVTPEGDKLITPLPVIPQEFSDSNSANWNSISLLGRSVDYQIYTGSSREVSFSLQLHQELYSDTAVELGTNTNNIYNIVKLIESSCYPYYKDAWAGPPEVVFKIGKHLYIKGVLTSCNVNWKLPIDLEKDSPTYGKYTNCDISVSVRETNGPYGAYDIAGGGKGNGIGSYRDKIVYSEPIVTGASADEIAEETIEKYENAKLVDSTITVGTQALEDNINSVMGGVNNLRNSLNN